MTGTQSDHLIKMAKEIIRNVGVGSDEDAVGKTVEHIEKFWTVSMRLQLVEKARSSREKLPALLDEVVTLIESRNPR